MTTKTIQIPEDVVKDIQEKDVTAQSIQAIISDLANSHGADTQDTISVSPVFMGLMKQLTAAKIEFENAKNDMVLKYLKPVAENVSNWSLDYGTGELSYE